uniref:Uncharacterized protein n=1 Tax=viral metagenome TaxID=1070528 RepID=A0A6C0LTA6_9ZZZZ
MSLLPQDDFHTKIQRINKLFELIKIGQYEQFLNYLSILKLDEIDVNTKDDNSNYLLLFAIIINNSIIVRKLIDYGAILDYLDSDGYTFLYYPIKLHYPEIIKTLIEIDQQTIGISLINLKDAKGQMPLFYCIKYRNHFALEKLLEYGADVNYQNNEGLNALHLAVLKKDIIMVNMIIKHTQNIDAKTLLGDTALHDACNFRTYDIVKILLENGANQNISDNVQDFYPIFYAVIQNDVEVTKLLINFKSDPNHQDVLGNTIIHYAILYNNIDILDYIFDNYEINGKQYDLYTEDINQHNKSIELKIDPTIVNLDGLTILQLMLYHYSEQFDKYIIKIIPLSNINYQDNLGNTVMHIIIENNLWEKFESLFDFKKINIYVKNNEGQNAIDMIPMIKLDSFINMITKSYFNYLRMNNYEWLLEWQNKCAKIEMTELNEEHCKQYIRDSIINEKISIPVKKNKQIITIEPDNKVYFSTFTGSILDMICGFKYLSKKYTNVTSLFHNITDSPELDKYYQSLNIEIVSGMDIAHFEIRWIYQRLFFPPNFDQNFTKILNDTHFRYIIIPVGIIMSSGFDIAENHSNCLFYDIKNNILERFEPHGSDYPYQFNYNPVLLDKLIYKKFNNLIKGTSTLKYLVPKNYLPKFGFQRLDALEVNYNKNIGDPNGFCTLWCIWYLDQRLKYINEKPKHIIKKLITWIKQNNYSFRNIIRDYSKNITQLRDDYLESIGKDINDYINYRLNNNDKKKLLEYVLNDNQPLL